MANVDWIGNAPARAQVRTWLFGGTWEATDIVDVEIGTNTVSISAGSSTIATLGATVAAALNALTIPEFAEITWSFDTATLTATGDTAGLPFEVAVSTRDVGGAADSQTIDGVTSSAGTDTTTATGPNDAANAANWSGGAVPSSSDAITIAVPRSILYGLTALAAVATSTFKVLPSFWAGGASIGLPKTHGSGSQAYNEYRSRYLQLDGATLIEIGRGQNVGGSGIIQIDTQTGTVTACTVYSSPNSPDPARKAIDLLINPGAASNGNVEILGGSVSIAFDGGDSKVTAKVVGDASDVVFGTGVTHGATTLVGGGRVEINTATTAITKTGGTLFVNGTGAHASLKEYGGQTFYNSTGALGATLIDVGAAGTLDFSQDMSAKTISSTILMAAGATLNDPHGVVGSLAYQTVKCRKSDVVVNSPVNKTWTAS